MRSKCEKELEQLSIITYWHYMLESNCIVITVSYIRQSSRVIMIIEKRAFLVY